MSRNREPTTEGRGGVPSRSAVSRGPSPGRFRSLLALAVVSLLIVLAVAGLKSYRELSTARERQQLLESRIAETRRRNEDLEIRLERLESDPAVLERLAREDLRMANPGDVVIVLPDEAAGLRAGRTDAP